MSEGEIVKILSSKLLNGEIPPWKVESLISEEHGINAPENFILAAKARRDFLEKRTGLKFEYLSLPDKPYLINYACRKCNIDYQLAAYDEKTICSLCGDMPAVKKPEKMFPFTANYIGGIDDYFSYCGMFDVHGDIEKQFTGILQYGTGLGPIGVTRGAFFINRSGGAEVTVSESARACRNLGYIFADESARKNAMRIVEEFLPYVRKEMNGVLQKWGGEVSFVELLPVEDMGKLYLFIDFTAEFKLFRGHGAISKATGFAKKLIDDKFHSEGFEYQLSGITQGYDGDLKPSLRNKRGRYGLARVSVPKNEIEKLTGKPAQHLIDFVQMDAKGAEKLGWFHHTGMGGEIIAGFYKATKVNPHAPLVSSTQKIFCLHEGKNIVYGVELPNVEVGTISSAEGAIPPLGREMMRFMGITNAREYAACLSAIVLAGEFNLSVEIVRENLYKPSP